MTALRRLKQSIKRTLVLCDAPLACAAFMAALVLKAYRNLGAWNFPLTSMALRRIGIFPIRDHYYEPLFNYSARQQIFAARAMPAGIDFRISDQLALLRQLNYQKELLSLREGQTSSSGFYYDNPSYSHGDADIWYGIIRHRKPRLIIEIGSGFSTAMAKEAISKNNEDDPSYSCEHICIEPYPKALLKSLDVQVIPQVVEDLSPAIFDALGPGDILFVDSSHMIRPGGDVLYEVLDIIPRLKKGVLIHIHDIFTPWHYPQEWLVNKCLFWNEQYLVEAFLSFNTHFRVVLATHYLARTHFAEMKRICPGLSEDAPPAALYFERL